MNGDINRFVSELVHEINMRLDSKSEDVESMNYNLGLETAKVEAKKLLKRWKESR